MLTGSPDWATLYPVKESSGAFDPINDKTVHSELAARGQLLSPRMACKLFHDGLLLIKKGEETPKFIQDRIPEVAHKCFKVQTVPVNHFPPQLYPTSHTSSPPFNAAPCRRSSGASSSTRP